MSVQFNPQYIRSLQTLASGGQIPGHVSDAVQGLHCQSFANRKEAKETLEQLSFLVKESLESLETCALCAKPFQALIEKLDCSQIKEITHKVKTAAQPALLAKIRKTLADESAQFTARPKQGKEKDEPKAAKQACIKSTESKITEKNNQISLEASKTNKADRTFTLSGKAEIINAQTAKITFTQKSPVANKTRSWTVTVSTQAKPMPRPRPVLLPKHKPHPVFRVHPKLQHPPRKPCPHRHPVHRPVRRPHLPVRPHRFPPVHICVLKKGK